RCSPDGHPYIDPRSCRESGRHGRECSGWLASLLGDNLIKFFGRRCPLAAASPTNLIDERVRTVKKIIVLALVALGAFAVYRKIQADRAELDLWPDATEAGPVGAAPERPRATRRRGRANIPWCGPRLCAVPVHVPGYGNR